MPIFIESWFILGEVKIKVKIVSETYFRIIDLNLLKTLSLLVHFGRSTRLCGSQGAHKLQNTCTRVGHVSMSDALEFGYS